MIASSVETYLKLWDKHGSTKPTEKVEFIEGLEKVKEMMEGEDEDDDDGSEVNYGSHMDESIGNGISASIKVTNPEGLSKGQQAWIHFQEKNTM